MYVDVRKGLTINQKYSKLIEVRFSKQQNTLKVWLDDA